MKIGLRGGHSPNCKGAFGYLDEQAEVRKIYNELVPMLQAAGHQIIDCNSNANNVSGELSEGTNKANENKCDIYMTLHMNASVNLNAGGVEVWLYDNGNSEMNTIAAQICQNLSSKGLINRGVKYTTGLHDLNASNMPAMIVEVLFCTGAKDVGVYNKLGAKGIAEQIAKAIDQKATQKVEKVEQEERRETTMQCVFSVEGKKAMYFYDGQNVRIIGHPDELKILQEIYRANNGRELPSYAWKKSAPWWNRLLPMCRDSRIVTEI